MDDFSRVMTVKGMTSLAVTPDTASIVLEVITENQSLSQAQQENTYVMERVIQSLLQANISREFIQTTAYTINPLYDFEDGKQEFRTYQVIHSITVKIHRIEQTGQVIDLAVNSGVNRVSNIEFTVSNPYRYHQRALSDALQHAVAKAQALAETIKVVFDPTPIKIIEEVIEAPHFFSTFASLEVSQATPIEPGQIVIQARVEAQFRY